MSDRATADFLATVPLLAGRDEADLAELARVLRRRDGARRARLSGARARRRGSCCSSSTEPSRRRCTLPGDRSVEIGTAGRRGDGRRARAARRRRAHDERARDRDRRRCSRSAGGLRGAARPPGSVGVQRSSAASPRCSPHASASQLRHLAASLGGDVAGPPAEDAARTFAELEYCGPPDSKYVRRMATFHDFDPLALWGFLTSGQLCPVPAGAHAARRRRAVDGLLPDDQRRGREGADARRPAHPRRARGARARRSATRA